MFSFLTDYLKDGFVRSILGASPPFTKPSNLYLALGTNIPEPSDTTLTEPVGNGYVRVALGNDILHWLKLAPGQYANIGSIQFAKPTASWGTLESAAIFDASTSGNMLFCGALRRPVVVDQTNPGTVYFPTGNIVIGISGSGARRAGFSSDYLNDMLMVWLVNGGAITVPTPYVALCKGVPQPSDTGLTIPEVNVGASPEYLRKALGTTTKILAGRYQNSAAIPFASPITNWGTVIQVAVVDNLSSSIGSPGNLLWGGVLDGPIAMTNGATALSLAIGQLQLGLGSGW